MLLNKGNEEKIRGKYDESRKQHYRIDWKYSNG